MRARGRPGASAATGRRLMSMKPSCPGSAEAAQESDDAPHPNARHTGEEVSSARTFSNRRQRRTWHYHARKRPDIQSPADRQRPGGDQFSGGGADDGGAEDLAASVGPDLDVPHGPALGLGAVVLMIRRT